MYNIVILDNTPIFEQLKIEEALLRADENNWCLINTGSTPAIVMGISGKAEKLINLEKTSQDNIPIIKRFSGGGTVYVDEHTLFVTFITNGPATPKSILDFTKTVYTPFFPKAFVVQENDYAFGEMKFGGNAQYIQRNRWLHHTSFLWDFNPKNMHYLLMPEKQPKYRQERSHSDFLCSLKEHYPCKAHLIEQLKCHLIKEIGGEEAMLPSDLMNREYRSSTEFERINQACY